MKIYHWVLLGVLTLCLGCGSGESDNLTSAVSGGADASRGGPGTKGDDRQGELSGTPEMTPKEILEKMVTAYKKAGSYTDQGQVQLSGETSGGSLSHQTSPINLVAPLSMSLEKPNKVLICANQGTAICDGKDLYEYVESLPHQVLRKPSPEKMTIESIFTEPILADAMAQGPTQYYTWIPIQAVLLLAEDPLKTLLYNVEHVELLPPAKIDDRSCYRVAIERHDGKAVFWIDPQSFVLRRFEYPTGGVQDNFRRRKVDDLRIIADFRGATLDAKINERTFSFQPPKKTRIVETLVPLNIYMLGRKAPDFFFRMLDGKPVTLKSLAGKTVILDFWASWSMQSQASLNMTDKTAEEFQDDDRVVILACSTDRKTVTDKEIKKMLEQMKVSLPICRDENDFARREFFIPGVPATVIIGPDGIIQDYQVQRGSRYGYLFEQTVRAVSEGIDVYKQKLALFEHLRMNYQKVIEYMLAEDLFIDPESIAQRLPIPGVADRSPPENVRVYPIWICKDVGVPGNIMVLDDADPPRILVCHDSHSLVELDSGGSVVKNYRFSIPTEDAAITNLRTGKTKEGKRFYVGFAPGFRHFFFLDENFNVKWSFPDWSETGTPQGIADVRVGDLAGDGTPEIYVAYRNDSEIKAVSLAGKMLWSTREVSGVTKMAIEPHTPENPGILLCTTDKTSLVGLNEKGKIAKRLDLDDRRFYWITAAPFGVAQLGESGKTCLCGLSAPGIGKNEAFGISLDGDLTWAYQLPDGTPGSIINRITSGCFSSSPSPKQEEQWVLLGADSSIHLISESGKPLDCFNYGRFVAGMTAAKLKGRNVLLVSSLNGVEALSIEQRSEGDGEEDREFRRRSIPPH